MLFNSFQFIVFFPIVVLMYYVIPDRVKQLWLLAASYYFYMCWNAKYALLMLFSTAVTYASGLLLDAENRSARSQPQKEKRKKGLVALSFALNLAVLFLFKYLGFALLNLGRVLSLVHIQLNVPAFDFLLPVGISFYTFQALSYTVDVYCGEVYAEKNFFRYALFVSFFPQLVAGPIERSKNLLKQLAVPKRFDFEAARDGLLLMLWGYFLKIVLADRIAIFVDTVYGDTITYTGWYLIVAAVLFAIQIYCDFYGYSAIAMGAAEILGIRLIENFNTPYLASTVNEFWQRWHISLTLWFRDYLYNPVVVKWNRAMTKWPKDKRKKYRSLPLYAGVMLTFLVSGLWHGAAWKFVAWGGLNGIYIVTENATKKARRKMCKTLGINRESLGWQMVCCAFTFSLVSFSLVFFRAEKLSDTGSILREIFTARNIWVLLDGSLYTCGLDEKNFRLMLVCIGILLFADLCKKHGIALRKVIARQDYWFRCLFIAGAVCSILLFGVWGPEYNAANFIYFQF